MNKIKTARILLYVLFGLVVFGVLPALAATNISSDPAEHWAWNDIAGWINFYATGDVEVSSPKMSGNATGSALGYLSMDCENSPDGNICTATTSYRVINDGGGWFSGWAWNDTYGWFSFCGSSPTGSPACPTSTVDYQVKSVVSSSRSEFQGGYAWNDIIGWVVFNCVDTPGGCGTSNFRVMTDWYPASAQGRLDSAIFDSGAGGAQLNSVMIRGSIPEGGVARVSIQFATSNSTSGPWNDSNYLGWDGTSGTVYTISAALLGTPIPLNADVHKGRYFRYRLILVSNESQNQTPVVDEVIINRSP